MLKEFKDFAMKGNVLDMAIGVIIGGAFGKIVSSLVSDVLMPPPWFADGEGGFPQPVHQSVRYATPVSRRSQGGGSSHHQLRGLSPSHI